MIIYFPEVIENKYVHIEENIYDIEQQFTIVLDMLFILHNSLTFVTIQRKDETS